MQAEFLLNGSSIRGHYSEWLQEHHWDYFLTITYRQPRKEPYYALQQGWHCLERHGAGKAFLVAEPHQTGMLHLHGIVSGVSPTMRPPLSLPWDIWSDLHRKFGRSQVAPIREIGGVAAYCSKYVLKSRNTMDLFEVFGDKYSWQY